MRAPSRRLLLRSALATVALPLLPSALPRASWAEAPVRPQRLLFYYVPNGIQTTWFTPDQAGDDFEFGDISAPLEPVRDRVSILTGFANVQAEDAVAGDHARGTGSFLTGVPIRRTAGSDVQNGVSVDQVAAGVLGRDTLFPSLQVGIQPGGNTGDCTAGYSCAYTRNVAWADDSTPLPNITDPRVLFERLFGVATALDPQTRQLRALARASVLDEVLGEATTLSARLGADDRAKLDQYLTAVREVEVRASALGGGGCASGDPPGEPTSYPAHVDVMHDMLVLALQCDLSRVATFMLGEAASNQTYDFIGVPGAHHATSHHQGQAQLLADLVKIGAWEVEQLTGLVSKLAATPDGDGTLLDSTLVCWSSEISDGNSHSHRDLPVILCGEGGGVHAPGRHLVVEADRPIADLFLTLLQGVGVETDAFGADGLVPVAELAG
ncbi:MAG: DUF1552 domain-containing protein [Myxococcota bacterium]